MPDMPDSDEMPMVKERKFVGPLASQIIRRRGVTGFEFGGLAALDATGSRVNSLAEHDPEGEQLKDFGPEWKGHEDFVQKRFLLIKGSTGILPIGHPTKDGIVLDWKEVALSMAKLCGAKGGMVLADTDKVALFTTLCKCYALLGKEAPTVKGVPLSEVIPGVLMMAEFHEFEFRNDEKGILFENCLASDVQNVQKALQAIKSDGDLSDATRANLEQLKAMVEEMLSKTAAKEKAPAAEPQQPSRFRKAAQAVVSR